ncbi:MAG: DUF4097 domain-containing protein, partial [bacterium]|nr:DUF4097 domain-containing protein [bacterium]
MKPVIFKKFFYVTLIAALSLLAVSCTIPDTFAAETKDVINKSFNVSEGGVLTMDVDGGSIEVNTTNGEKVEVEVIMKVKTSSESKARKMFDDYKLNFKHTGSDVFIDSDYRRDRGLFSWGKRGLRVRFIVTVPQKYDLDLRTSGGSISVNDIEGEVKVKTSGGSLKLGAVKGEVRAKTSGGSIKLEGCTGDADVYTSGGSISIGRVQGKVKAHTSGGAISVKEVMGTINASSSGGSVSAYISKQPAGDCSLKTSGGSVSVSLAGDIKVDVDAKTSGGRVYSDFSSGGKSKKKL